MKKALIIVDHGSVFAAANDQLESIAKILSQRDHDYVFIIAAHMELAHPTIEEAFDECVSAGCEEVVIHPYFLAPGRHSTTDIPRLSKDAANKYPNIKYRVSEPLGIHEKIIDVVLERSAED